MMRSLLQAAAELMLEDHELRVVVSKSERHSALVLTVKEREWTTSPNANASVST